MDGLSAAASILAIGAAGAQVSIKLAAFANQVGTAPNRIRSIASDVSLTANVLQQLSELLNKNDNDKAVSVFNKDGLATTQASADACKSVFQELDDVLKRASQQIRENRNKTALGQNIVLSKHERMRWPFLQPKIDSLRTALRDARETLMLMLHVTTLGYMKKQAEMTRSSTGVSFEQSEVVSAILALHSQGFALAHDIVHRPKTEQSEIDATLPAKEGTRAIDCSNLDVQAGGFPPSRQESLSSSSTSINRSIFDAPNRPASSETDLTRASTKSSLPQTPVFLSGLQNRVKEEAEHKVPDQGSNQKLKQPTLHKPRDKHLQKQSILETTARATTTMEAWMVMPRVFRADGGCGYDLRWGMNVWPLDSAEMKRLVREMSGWRKPDTLKQLASLTSMEREVVNRYLAQRGNSLKNDFTVKGVGFRSMEPTVEPNTRMPWRSIQVLIARTPSARIVPCAQAVAQSAAGFEEAPETEGQFVNDGVPKINRGDRDRSAATDHEHFPETVLDNSVPLASLPSIGYSFPTYAAYHPQSSQQSIQSTPVVSNQSLQVVQERSKPQCWDHGCNGREFTTFSNLLRHQREASGVSSKSTCPRCGAEFTGAAARNAHVIEGKCTQKLEREKDEDQPEQLKKPKGSVIKKPSRMRRKATSSSASSVLRDDFFGPNDPFDGYDPSLEPASSPLRPVPSNAAIYESVPSSFTPGPPIKDRVIVAPVKKRKRSSAASHRYPRRQKDTELENANYIAKLERQIREMTQERDFRDMEDNSQQDEAEEAADDVADSVQDFSAEAGSLEIEIESFDYEMGEPDSEEGAEESEAERIIQDLLGRYTTLYEH